MNEQELPEDAPVQYVYALLLMGDKGYAVREDDAGKWGMIEGLLGEATVDEFLKRSAASAGATIGTAELIGFFECRATRHNTEFKQGELTVRPFYVISAKTVKDVPEGSRYERRRFPLNEYAVAMRTRYPELTDYLVLAFARYAVMRAKG